MLFNFGYQSALLLFFFLHGLVFSGLLLRNGIRENNVSSYWLSALVFLCCLYIVPWMCGHAGWYANDGYREFLFFVPLQHLFLIGPVIYFYVRSLLTPATTWRGVDYAHFAPAIVYLLYILSIYLLDQFYFEAFYFYADGRDRDLDTWYQVSGLASMIIYIVLSIRSYGQYRELIFEQLSFADSVTYGWIKRFLFALLLILVLRITFLILYPDFGSFGQKWYYYTLFSVLVYYISIAGYTQAIRSSLVDLPVNQESRSYLLGIKASPQTDPSERQEESFDLVMWKNRLTKLMTDQELYRKPILTLADIADKLDTNSKQISLVVNRGFKVNFNDYVNSYRVEAVKRAFAEGLHEQRTILGIALDCGFNSKSTFNRSFKQHARITPGQYLRQLAQDD